MNIRANTIVEMVEDVIKSKAKHFDIEGEKPAPDVDEFLAIRYGLF